MPPQHLRALFSDSSSRGALRTSPLYSEVALADPVEYPLQAPPLRPERSLRQIESKIPSQERVCNRRAKPEGEVTARGQQLEGRCHRIGSKVEPPSPKKDRQTTVTILVASHRLPQKSNHPHQKYSDTPQSRCLSQSAVFNVGTAPGPLPRGVDFENHVSRTPHPRPLSTLKTALCDKHRDCRVSEYF